MSMLGINSALVGMYQFVASKGIAKTERADTTETSFINQLKETGGTAGTGGCADSPERVAEVNAINKAKREKEAAQRKANMERSREAAEEQKRQMDIAYQKKSLIIKAPLSK